jgi:polyhydroxyalkanoate synthase
MAKKGPNGPSADVPAGSSSVKGKAAPSRAKAATLRGKAVTPPEPKSDAPPKAAARPRPTKAPRPLPPISFAEEPPAPILVAVPEPAPKLPAVVGAKPEAAKPDAAKPEGIKPQPPKDDARKTEAPKPADPMQIAGLDVEKLTQNVGRIIEESGKAVAAYLKPREDGRAKVDYADQISDMVKTLGHVAQYWMEDPQRAVHAQSQLAQGFMGLWTQQLRRMAGEQATPAVEPDPKDGRFKDPEWSSNQYFDTLKQAYLLTANWAQGLVKNAQDLDPHTRHKADFYVKQIAAAVSPSNFLFTNPELMRETVSSSGDNLARGMHMLAEDIEAGHGDLKIRQSDPSKFAVGVNMAMTPGKVIYQNDLMQLIQYTPTTEKVLKTPLLIVPPWINKFYILDLNPEKSFIRWAVAQGLTVFVVSWVNPDEHQAKKGFDAYMKEGPLTALDVIEKITGERQVHSIGYCVGGTLLAVTLAWMAAKGDDRILSATLFTTQVDFTHAGDLKVFADEEQIASLERKMNERGYLEGSKMANAFNMLRANDLIWPYIVNNYLRGKAPFPFDLLYWNSDSTRMPAANHSFYLRNCYLENNLSNGRMVVDGVKLDLKKVKIPIYNLASREDHIAPARSVFVGSAAFGGPVTYVMAGSGHIAGVVNPADKPKYQYWTGGPPQGRFEDWVTSAKETPGSWWPHWRQWIGTLTPAETKAREPGGGKFKPIEDAPGSYVAVKS